MMGAREEVFRKLKETQTQATDELTLNPSLEKRGTFNTTREFRPFSFQEKGLGDEFLAEEQVLNQTENSISSGAFPSIKGSETTSEDRNEIITLFTRNLEEAGGEVRVFTSADDLRAWLREFVETNSINSAVISAEQFVKQLGIAASLKDVPAVRVVEMGEKDVDYRAYTEQTQLGIGLAHAGIAESGAIIIASSPKESRSLSLLVETHIAMLDAKNLWKRLPDASPIIDSLLMSTAAAVTIVAGPSKTADIEKVLITGVHGPKRFIVCIVDVG
jgi:L-lactate dehydrogenase complex protein LldG